MTLSNIERRLRQLESASKASGGMEFWIEDDGDRPGDERLRMLGILDKPGRQFHVIDVRIVHPGPQPPGGFPPDTSPHDSGNWRYEPLHKEPKICSFALPGLGQRPGSEWVREC